VLVVIDICLSIEGGGANHRLAASGGHLKRLTPSDVFVILPLIHLWLIGNDGAARLVHLARPPRILCKDGYSSRQQEYENRGKNRYALHGDLLPHHSRSEVKNLGSSADARSTRENG
jgi:hypothetical protein